MRILYAYRQDNYGDTMLLDAAFAGNSRLLAHLLQYNINVNHQNFKGGACTFAYVCTCLCVFCALVLPCRSYTFSCLLYMCFGLCAYVRICKYMRSGRYICLQRRQRCFVFGLIFVCVPPVCHTCYAIFAIRRSITTIIILRLISM